MISRRHLLAGAGAATLQLAAPARAGAESAADGVRILRATAAASAAGGNAPTTLWGYDATVPGPALRVKRGAEVRLRLVNDLPSPTRMHWHGVRLPEALDRAAPPVAPGANFDYRFRPPDAGTFWYHAAAADQLDHGLYGALIVEETEPVAADRDLLLVFGMPREGDAVPFRVNGAIRPDFPVKRGERVRLRLINATAARGLVLRLEDHVAWVTAIDGQPAEPFRARESRVGLAPGGRADLFVDMTRDGGAAQLVAGVRDAAPVAQLVYEGGGPPTPPRADPAALPDNPLPARIDLKNSLRAELAIANAQSGKRADTAAPLFSVRRGRAVTLTIRNPTGAAQVVHVHGHAFRLLDRLDDGWKPYWMDTMVVGNEVERIAFVAENPGKWPIDVRPLDQGDGATAWFVVA